MNETYLQVKSSSCKNSTEQMATKRSEFLHTQSKLVRNLLAAGAIVLEKKEKKKTELRQHLFFLFAIT